MLLAREFVGYLSRQIVQRLVPVQFETASTAATADLVQQIITEELAAEDRLNDEVRDILEQYSEYMRREGVSYSEMFRKAKNQLLAQRKIVRASGRDSGDNMKLSRDKVNDISHKVVAALRKDRNTRVRKDPNEVRLQLVTIMNELLAREEMVDRAARDKVRTLKRDVLEGSEEWDLLHRRYYAEKLKELGIDLAK